MKVEQHPDFELVRAAIDSESDHRLLKLLYDLMEDISDERLDSLLQLTQPVSTRVGNYYSPKVINLGPICYWRLEGYQFHQEDFESFHFLPKPVYIELKRNRITRDTYYLSWKTYRSKTVAYLDAAEAQIIAKAKSLT
jgi:hypothetical protein